LERKLTAILCADVHGYSRLMGEREEATLRTLTSYRKLIDGLIQHHRGRFVNSAGDSVVVAEFAQRGGRGAMRRCNPNHAPGRECQPAARPADGVSYRVNAGFLPALISTTSSSGINSAN
jgi:class 3 adenylate cyclase